MSIKNLGDTLAVLADTLEKEKGYSAAAKDTILNRISSLRQGIDLFAKSIHTDIDNLAQIMNDHLTLRDKAIDDIINGNDGRDAQPTRAPNLSTFDRIGMT